ncbi:hypothetical protein NBE98_12355 [Clostridium swellfunianum]|uniref:hypothetical protein n=1 Tax=Clostridium swellfunianum TaxID=1367462 RepID=UPI00203096AB|nr:hypothetical protein [Clostridium swellfunianum]MCM0649168.1 hypothetical protein [Clostridium swellfunianum]
MKFDSLSMLHVMILVVFFAGILYTAINIAKTNIVKYQCRQLKGIYTCALDYSRTLVKKQYVCFEKYDIWRYCVHF